MLVCSIIGTIIQVLVLCLLVGLLLAFFDISPYALIDGTRGEAHGALTLLRHAVRWASGYIALGAVIVLPLTVVLLLVRAVRSL